MATHTLRTLALVVALVSLNCWSVSADADIIVNKYAAELAKNIGTQHADNIAVPLLKGQFLAQDLIYLLRYHEVTTGLNSEECADKQSSGDLWEHLAKFNGAAAQMYKTDYFPADKGVDYSVPMSGALEAYFKFYVEVGAGGCAPQAASMALCLCGYNGIVEVMKGYLAAHRDRLTDNEAFLVDKFTEYNYSGSMTSCKRAKAVITAAKLGDDVVEKLVSMAFVHESALWSTEPVKSEL